MEQLGRKSRNLKQSEMVSSENLFFWKQFACPARLDNGSSSIDRSHRSNLDRQTDEVQIYLWFQNSLFCFIIYRIQNLDMAEFYGVGVFIFHEEPLQCRVVSLPT